MTCHKNQSPTNDTIRNRTRENQTCSVSYKEIRVLYADQRRDNGSWPMLLAEAVTQLNSNYVCDYCC
jgi:hypothetical protein